MAERESVEHLGKSFYFLYFWREGLNFTPTPDPTLGKSTSKLRRIPGHPLT